MHSYRSLAQRVVAAAALLLPPLLPVRHAASQITLGADTTAQPLGLSISGAISVGAYQAGVNWGLLEVYRHAAWEPKFHDEFRIPRYRLRTVTGASAGNINTLLWALEACTDRRSAAGTRYVSPSPEASLFWQVWTEIGLHSLLNTKGEDLALLDRRGVMDVATRTIEERMKDPALYPGCSVPAGITLTRIQPDTLRYQKLDIPTQRYVTVFGVVVGPQSDQDRLHFRHLPHNFAKDNQFGKLALLPLAGGEIEPKTLLQAVQASASFPVAFAPVPLSLLTPETMEPGREGLFMDGGVFDNNPLGLARDLYHVTNGRGDLKRLDILFVNPDLYRGRLDTARASQPKPASPGGIAAVLQLLGGAVPTARKYELQLIARERAERLRQDTLLSAVQASFTRRMLQYEQQVREYSRRVQGVLPGNRALRAEGGRIPELSVSDTMLFVGEQRDSLHLSSRGYPIFGEHLHAFAGFLGRPAREFDFYAGVYDGLYMAAAEHTCSVPNGASSQEVDRACIAGTLRGWIRDTTFVRDPARQVLATLYDREFPPTGGTLPLSSDPALAPADSMRDVVQVMRGMFVALSTQFALPEEGSCRWTTTVKQLLCTDGIGTVLDSLRGQPEVLRTLRKWASACPKNPRYPCADRQFLQLVEDPVRAMGHTTDELLDRLRTVEGMMKEDTTRKSDDYRMPVTLLQWYYHASNLRTRPLFEWFPSSIPENQRGFYRLVPSYVGANLGSSGFEFRYEIPALNLTTAYGLHGTVLYHRNNQPALGGGRHNYVGIGAGFNRFLRKWYATEAGIEYHRFQALTPFARREGRQFGLNEGEGYLKTLAGRLRISTRYVDRSNALHAAGHWGFSFGLTDLPGLVFWTLRAL